MILIKYEAMLGRFENYVGLERVPGRCRRLVTACY